jgi:hypothetical protein
MPRSARILYVLAFTAYAVSFLLPAFVVITRGVPDEGHFGFEAFYLSLVTVNFVGEQALTLWLANPAFWVASVLVLARKAGLAAFFAGLAFFLGMWCIGDGVLVGYYVWLGSFALLFIGTLCELASDERDDDPIELHQGEDDDPIELHQSDDRITTRRGDITRDI